MRTYAHQRTVAKSLLINKRNVILQAPTGSGKFYAALLPFFNAIQHGRDFPRKCIYAVPMRVLAKQFYEEAKLAVLQMGMQKKINVTIQTGEQQEDREFTGDLIFATIDQVLSSFLISPYSLSRSRANLNAGAVASSYLVFDEFHLYDPETTLPTTLHMLQMLKGIAPFLLMTATFSKEMLAGLAKELDAEVVGADDEERAAFRKLPSQQKERIYYTTEAAMDADVIAQQHTGRTLVICNTVARAQALYAQLEQSAPGVEVRLLHSQFLPEDRRTREDYIRTIFGKDLRDTNSIIVSTQAVEVGVDMSATILHTELAPANSIIQRAGRCARYKGERGEVFIYRRAWKQGEDGAELIDLTESTMPYQGQGEVIAATWDAFAARSGQSFSYDDEQEVLSAAHGAQDEAIISEIKSKDRNHRNAMYAVMRGDDGTDARNLIRNIMAQPVVIHADPQKVAEDPFAYPSFSLHPGTVQKHVKNWLDRYEICWDIAIIRDNSDEDAAQNNEERHIVTPISDAKAGWMAKVLVVHPRLATYDDKIGFIAEEGGDWQATLPEKKSSGEAGGQRYSYRLETYAEHIRLVHQAFTDEKLRIWPEVAWTAAAIERRAGWNQGSLYQAAELAVLLHDVGKLSKGWQGWVRDYQKMLVDAGIEGVQPAQPGEAYAHTDFDSSDDRYWEIQQKAGKRPWHAVEGALAVIPVLHAVLRNDALANATFSAIARHHAPYSDTYQGVQLEKIAPTQIESTLRQGISLPLNQLWGMKQPIQPHMNTQQIITEVDGKQDVNFLAYLLLVRVLRRADSMGTSRGSA